MGRLRLGLAAVAATFCTVEGGTLPAWADEPKAVIEGQLDRSLRRAIEAYIGQSKHAPHSRVDARRRAEQAANDAVVVLRSEGYYEYQATPDIGDGDPPKPVIRIDPGPLFHIASPSVTWVGPAPAAEAEKDARAAMKLAPGSPGRAVDVVAAEGRIVAALQTDGYADAKAAPRVVVVDHADDTVRPDFHIEPKALVRLGAVQLSSKGRTRQRWVRRLAPWRSGDVYAPDKVAELERRISETGVYDSVTVGLGPKADEQGLRPVVVSLADHPRGTVSLGASYSTSEGPGVNARYVLYNRFGRAETTTFAAQYASILKRLDAEVSFPHWRATDRTLKVGATLYEDDTDAFVEKDAGAHADLERRFGKTSIRTFGLSADYSDADEKALSPAGQIIARNRKLAILTGLARLSLDHSDDPLDPTRGWKFDGKVEPTVAAGSGSLAYAKAEATVSGYLPLGKAASTVLAGRIDIGSILSYGAAPDVPASRRFYAGGGGSIRGYAYQAVGPRFPDNTPIGGRSVFIASFEVRQHFGEKWGAVAFVDAGQVSAQMYPDFRNFSAGAGIGIRYNLGFGPLRADIATPLNPRKGDAPVQIYLSIGQSF